MIKIFNKKKLSRNLRVQNERRKYGTIGLDFDLIRPIGLLIDAQWNARLALQDTLNKERLISYKTRSIYHHTFGCV